MREDFVDGRRAAIVIILALFVLLDLRVALYHLITEGWKSGLTEMVLALWVMLLVYAAWEARRRRKSPFWRRLHASALVCLILISLFYLALSVYHFTHGGTRSGVVELLASVLLALLTRALA